MMIKTMHAGPLLLIFLASPIGAKEWRGITPLKSSRADVERLLGKPNELGRYEIQNERVRVSYSEGPCEGGYGGLAKTNCERLVAKDTVLKVRVTFEWPVKLSKLGIDKRRYERTPIHAYRKTATYSNFTEGIVYTIRESDHAVTNIDCLPSAKDCEEVVRSQTGAASTVWQGIVPLRSTRTDVERLLGPPTSSLGDIDRYVSAENRVDEVKTYEMDICAHGWDCHA
jgi:hypothetical protein